MKKKSDCSEAEQRRKLNQHFQGKQPRRNKLHRLEGGKSTNKEAIAIAYIY